MIATALLLSILAATPVERFARAFPGSERIATGDGTRLLHASGFLAAPAAAGPVEAARAFLASEGAAFGVSPAQELVLRGAPLAGRPEAVRFERRVGGLPVFGGDLVVGVDGGNRVFAVNAADVPAAAAGRHAIGEAAARAAALASFPGGARGAGPAAVTPGWRRLLSSLRAVYRVDFVAAQPPGDWRIFVDGETATPLFREDLRAYATAPGTAYEVSPTETAAAACAPSGGGLSFCASPVAATLNNLVAAPPTTLVGTQAAVYDCKGADAPTSPANVPGPCAPVSSASGAFSFPADGTFTLKTDDFAAAMAYYHLDRHVSFFKALDATLPGGTARALNGSLPGLVNAFEAGAPLENAYYSGGLDAMVFGQGATADYAYDATVIYHEFTHGVVAAWGGYNIDIDAQGGLDEPAAVNEGTADAMAASETGRSTIGSFITSTAAPAAPYLRDMDDPTATRTCRGDGTVVIQFGASAVNGLDGEVHDDGEIWNGFYWEVYQGLKAAGVKGCGGACEAAPAIQYGAVQLSGGTSPTLNGYWKTFKAAAAALFPSQPAVASYVDCVGLRRKFDGCDRTVPVYAGERKLEFVRLRWAPFQMVVQTTGPTSFQVCSLNGTATTVHARVGAPVALSAIDPATLNATVTETGSVAFTQACSGGTFTVSLSGAAATWYLLFESPAAVLSNTPGFDIYRVDLPASGVASRPAATAPPTCTFSAAPLAIAPAAPATPPRGSLSFAATGATGALTWSLHTNASGGTIDASTGAYTAGPTGGVTDVVQVVDGAAASATTNVAVTAGVSISPAAPTVTAGGAQPFTASGGSGTGYAWSLSTNASGGSIVAGTGAYTAGATGGVTDVVRVVDSLGNEATASVAVTAASSGGGGSTGSSSKSGCGCSSSGDASWALVLGLLALNGRRLAWRRRQRR